MYIAKSNNNKLWISRYEHRKKEIEKKTQLKTGETKKNKEGNIFPSYNIAKKS